MPAQSQEKITSRDVIGFMFQEYEQAMGRSWVSSIANEFRSTQELETYAGVGNVPAMREWLGGKNAHGFSEQSLTIRNKDWESTIQIPTKDLRRDKTGFLRMRIGELMDRAVEHDAKLISDLIENGTGTTVASCYDGAALFSDSHSVDDSGTIDNNISVDISALPVETHGTAVTAPSVAEFALSVLKGVTTLLGFKDNKGEPINQFNREFVVMVPTGLADVAELALNTIQLGDNVRNPMSGGTYTYRVVINPRLTWTDKFAVFAADSRFKPFIVQIEESPMFKPKAEGSDFEFDNAAHQYSVEKCGNVGLGRFDKSCLVTLA